jgi:hypothetical protein
VRPLGLPDGGIGLTGTIASLRGARVDASPRYQTSSVSARTRERVRMTSPIDVELAAERHEERPHAERGNEDSPIDVELAAERHEERPHAERGNEDSPIDVELAAERHEERPHAERGDEDSANYFQAVH